MLSFQRALRGLATFGQVCLTQFDSTRRHSTRYEQEEGLSHRMRQKRLIKLRMVIKSVTGICVTAKFSRATGGHGAVPSGISSGEMATIENCYSRWFMAVINLDGT